MKEIYLNGKKMINIESTYEYIKEKFNIPDYCGNNLDGMWDYFSSSSEEIKIYFINIEEMLYNLNDYGEKIVKLFKDIEIENEKIIFEIINDKRYRSLEY